MEEISSLDSFHTDGAGSTPRPDSEPPKLDEETSQTSVDKHDTTADTPTGAGDGGVGDVGDDEDAVKDSPKVDGGGDGGDGEGDGANIDEDFEQISDGTFEVDENSRATSVGPHADDNTQDKAAEVEAEGDGPIKDKEDEEKDKTTPAEGVDTQESTDFEEVDATLTAGGSALAADESDMLGESDMTLPKDGERQAGEEDVEEHETGEDKADTSAMEVDHEEDDEQAPTPGDVEMASISNSPAAATDKDVPKSIENEDEEPQRDDSMEAGADEDVHSNGKDVVDDAPTADETAAEKQNKNNEEDNEDEDGEKEKTSEKDAEADAAEDDDAEQEDEPVENVQEPEESDVCLIPDDTETQVTDAEKEQAILARENAEKEDADAEAEAEKEKDTADSTAKESEAPASAVVTGEKVTDAEAQAVQAGAEATAAGSEGNSEENTTAADADAGDAPDVDEPLLEEMQTTTGESGVSTSKIIIAWIVATTQKCKHCDAEKTCGFRYKNPENSEFEYICEQSCCDALLIANPGKYFIRRKKFLIEELGSDSSSIAAAPESANSGNDGEKEKVGDGEKSDTVAEEDVEKSTTATPAASHVHHCLQCKEEKRCKYFFKQDDESFYICNDDCYNLLNVEEPDKFKLKRHSIRVRNIGATTISTPTVKKTSSSSPESRVVARTATEAEAARLERVASFTRRCADCFTEITLGDKNLLWETMDFCNELCLGKYQRTIGANCQTCHGEVPHQALGKYCVRFGFDIKQFCCAACLNEYKKGLKTCSCCQKDISSGNEGFLAPVGDKEQFKDFCSQACMRRYDSMCNPKKKLRNDVCAVCNNDKPVRVEIMLDSKEHNFCSNPCFSAFKFVSNIVADQCGMCAKYFERKGSEAFTIYTERRAKVFCSRVCLNVYIIVNRRIVSCQWCKVKKYNFDMIYKQQDAQEILMCSLNCLTLYGVSINAFSRTVAKCDNCTNSATPQYHLTMSDASMRNFCTYQCVMQFQSQFARAPLTLESEAQSAQQPPLASTSTSAKSSAPFPTGLPKRVKLKVSQQQKQPSMQIKLPTKNSSSNKKGPTMPVISTVSSLASGETETMIGSVTVRRSRGRGRKLESPPPLVPALASASTSTVSSGRGRPRRTVDYGRSPSPVSMSPPRSSSNKRGAGATTLHSMPEKVTTLTETKIIAVPPYPPKVRNVQTSCKPQTVTVGFQCEPSTATVGTQTGKDYSNKVLIPVPVPIYVPQPMYMYSAPFPVPIPIPLPIPVPIFIPTTRNSSQGILKEIKKIQDKMPADPFEAELLMMAEMVAEEKRESDSDSDEEIKPDPGVVSMQYNNSVQQVEVANNSYGEDVLQMALKMATGDYDQPSVDLESAMTTNTITNPPPGMVGHDDSMSHMSAHHLQQQQQQLHVMESQRGGRGRKRGTPAIVSPVSPRNNRSPVKRQRLQEIESSPQTPTQPMQPVEKPDANMCLKYTFGVNAWKQWVMTKNADIEKSSVRRRTFKTELLQMTADELNYSLCLFVKEVRKPNGTEYAPDTIYYLVLGIQQYLYENGRIDNIFTDPYYERFTDCLDEVARKFSVLYNDSQYIVTRVEEEHLWECKQLGAHSPHVLLSTLMFFNTKHFNLTTVEEHMQLSFSHIMKHWKRSAQNAKTPGTRNVLLRFYPPQAGLDANPRKKKVYEQQENEENPLRCPVRLYEFYLSKCPESVKTRNDVFYLQPERSCVPDSPVWYSTQALSQEALQKMLHRVKMVKEINIALLTS